MLMKLTKRDNIFSDLMNWDPSQIWADYPRLAFPKMDAPRVDVEETDTDVIIRADVPGYDPQKVDIDVTPTTLTLSSEQSEEEERKTRRYYRHERTQRSFSRTVELPCEVKTENVKAQAKNGTLRITLPKKDLSKPMSRHVPIEET